MKTIKVPSNWGNPLTIEINTGEKVVLNAGETVEVADEIAAAIENALANLPKENKDIPLPEEIKNIQPMLITFNNTDFTAPKGMYFNATDAHITLTAIFDLSRLNFNIPNGSDYSIHKVLVQGEPFDLSILDNFVKSMDSLENDYGEGWIVEGDAYMYLHEYNFRTADNANAALAELTSIGITGFQLLVNNYNQITAQEV